MSSTNESYDRNHSLEIIHNTKLPSYALWGENDIVKEKDTTRLKWWEDVEKEYSDNGCKDLDIYGRILHWLAHYENK
jgi:hypothetical protein